MDVYGLEPHRPSWWSSDRAAGAAGRSKPKHDAAGEHTRPLEGIAQLCRGTLHERTSQAVFARDVDARGLWRRAIKLWQGVAGATWAWPVRLRASRLRAVLVTSGRLPVFLWEVRRVARPSKHAMQPSWEAQVFATWHDGAGDATVPTDGPIACQSLCQSQSRSQCQCRCQCSTVMLMPIRSLLAGGPPNVTAASATYKTPLFAVPLPDSFPDFPRL